MLALVLQKITFKKRRVRVSVRELSAINAIPDFLSSKANFGCYRLTLFGINTIFLSSHLLTPSRLCIFSLWLVLQRILGHTTLSFQLGVLYLHLPFKKEQLLKCVLFIELIRCKDRMLKWEILVFFVAQEWYNNNSCTERNSSWPTAMLEICPTGKNSLSVLGCHFPSGNQFAWEEKGSPNLGKKMVVVLMRLLF